MTFGSPKMTDSLLHGSSGSNSRPSVIRPLPVRLQERTCWQALYQVSPPPSSFRAREAGTRAFNMRFSRPGTILERFLRRPPRPSDTHCSTLIGFIGMVFGSRPNLSSTAVFVNPAASTVT
jgi:hypothetical protein